MYIFEEKIKKYLENKLIASKDELFNYYKDYDSEIKKSTFSWRLYDLKAKRILESKARGFYSLSEKKEFRPILEKKIKFIFKQIVSQNSQYGNQWKTSKWFCVWDINWLNEFLEHQLFSNYKIIEVEKNAIESVYYSLIRTGTKNVFLNPDKGLINRNIIQEKDSIVIRPLFSRSPLMKVENIVIPTLEKILVDLFYETDNYFQFQGSELKTIFRNVIEYYSINFGKLFNYARRRRIENEMRNFILINVDKNKINFII